MENFIGIYDNILSTNECGKIIDFFEKNPNKVSGKYYINALNSSDIKTGIDEKAKKSTDLECFFYSGNFSSVLVALKNTTDIYKKKYSETDKISGWALDSKFNIQRYLPNEAFFQPHCESGCKNTNHRVLAWMIYLNDINDGGETRFTSYDLDVKSKAGRVVIWPAFFTHIHHGIVSKTETKYIATGWYSYI